MIRKTFKPPKKVTFFAIGMTGDGLVGIPVATCRGCGCRDDRACPDGCAWATVDRAQRTGICTQCARKV
jgi:hypothetical protein